MGIDSARAGTGIVIERWNSPCKRTCRGKRCCIDFCVGMADRFVEFCCQSFAGSSDFASGDAEFKLCSIAFADVSGVVGVEYKISAGYALFHLDILQ